MNRDIAEKWIADLRANPPQAKGTLFDGHGHCCLGRLCIVAGKLNREISGFSILTDEIADWAGMKSRDGRYPGGFLVADNDSGKTFAEIAGIIEAHIDEL